MTEASDHPGTEARQLLSKMEQLEQRFETRLLSDAHKDKLIDQLHAELQGYRNQLIRNQVRPMLLDLIQIFDSYQKLLQDLPPQNTPESAQSMREALAMVPQDILDLLYRQGVEPFEVPEPVFQPQSQRMIQKLATEELSLHRQIAQRLRPGFVWDGEPIRQEWVNVYIHPNPENTAQKPEVSDSPDAEAAPITLSVQITSETIDSEPTADETSEIPSAQDETQSTTDHTEASQSEGDLV